MLFKQGVQPVIEYESAPGVRATTVRYRAELSVRERDFDKWATVWQTVVFALVGETLDPDDYIVGAYLTDKVRRPTRCCCCCCGPGGAAPLLRLLPRLRRPALLFCGRHRAATSHPCAAARTRSAAGVAGATRAAGRTEAALQLPAWRLREASGSQWQERRCRTTDAVRPAVGVLFGEHVAAAGVAQVKPSATQGSELLLFRLLPAPLHCTHQRYSDRSVLLPTVRLIVDGGGGCVECLAFE